MSTRSKKDPPAGSQRQKKPASEGQPLKLRDETTGADESPTIMMDEGKTAAAGSAVSGGYSVRPRTPATAMTDKMNALTDKIAAPDAEADPSAEIEDLEEVVVLLDEAPSGFSAHHGPERAESVGMMSHNPMNTEFIPDAPAAGNFATESTEGANVTEVLEIGNLPELGGVEDITTLIQEAPPTVPMEAPRSETAEFPLELVGAGRKPKRKFFLGAVAALLLVSGAGAYYFYGDQILDVLGVGAKNVAALGNTPAKSVRPPVAVKTPSPAGTNSTQTPAHGTDPGNETATTPAGTVAGTEPPANHDTEDGGPAPALAEREKVRMWLDGALIATLGAPERTEK